VRRQMGQEAALFPFKGLMQTVDHLLKKKGFGAGYVEEISPLLAISTASSSSSYNSSLPVATCVAGGEHRTTNCLVVDRNTASTKGIPLYN